MGKSRVAVSMQMVCIGVPALVPTDRIEILGLRCFGSWFD